MRLVRRFKWVLLSALYTLLAVRTVLPGLKQAFSVPLVFERADDNTNTDASSSVKQPASVNTKVVKISNTFDARLHSLYNFSWDDVDLSRKGNCGFQKCFFRSVSDPSNIGYLVGGDNVYARVKEAADIAQELQNKFGAKHFHLALTREDIDDKFRETLNGLVDQPAMRFDGRNNTRVFKKSKVMIETVRVAPEPSLVIATVYSNLKLTLKGLLAFHKLIPDKEAFREQMSKEYQRIKNILGWRPALAHDFQMIVDTEGNAYHIDLDGHLFLSERQNGPETRVKECLNIFDLVIKNLTAYEDGQFEIKYYKGDGMLHAVLKQDYVKAIMARNRAAAEKVST